MKQTYIPKGWNLVKLKDVIQEKSEKNINEQVKEVLSITNSQGFVKQEDYFEGTVHSKNIQNYKIVRKNQFAYNPSRINVGSIDILKKYEEGVLSPMYVVFQTNEDRLNSDYFKYYFETNEFIQNVKNSTQGSVRESLNFESLSSFEYLLPPLEEQKKIAGILSNVDCIIDKINEDIKGIQKQKQGIMKQLVIKGIGHKNFKITELGSIPKEWKIKTLHDIMEIYRGGSPRPISKYITKGEGINWIKIGDTSENTRYIYSTKEKITKEGIKRSRQVYENELLLSNSMSFGKPYILKTNGCIHDGWLVLKNYQNIYTTDFLYYLLSSDIIKKQYEKLAAGSGVKNLNKDLVGSIKVPILDKKEQNKIADILNKLDDKLELEERKKQEYQNLKKGLMQQLLTGKVRVKI